ncbi:hypothetical protein BH10ACI1_BH10ACI1_10630 [soil metagenome]
MPHSEIVFKVTVRGWDPKKKEEIVGRARYARTAPVPNIPPIPGMSPGVFIIPAAPAPLPIPYPSVLIYLPIDDLALAVSGTRLLNFGLELNGHNLRATLKNYTHKKKEMGVTFKIKQAGLISSRLQTLIGEDGKPRVYVPLEDVAKAFGGRLEINQAAWTFSIKVVDCPNCLLEYVPPDESDK